MKKSILLALLCIALLCIALILLAGCADLEERQAKELEFNEDNYTYEETIIENAERIIFGTGVTTRKQYYKEYFSTKKNRKDDPSLSVSYTVTNDVQIGHHEYWVHPLPQGVINIVYEGDIKIPIKAVLELAKPIIDYMNENKMFHSQYGVDFVRIKSRYGGYFHNPYVYNHEDDDDFVIKECVVPTLRYEDFH